MDGGKNTSLTGILHPLWLVAKIRWGSKCQSDITSTSIPLYCHIRWSIKNFLPQISPTYMTFRLIRWRFHAGTAKKAPSILRLNQVRWRVQDTRARRTTSSWRRTGSIHISSRRIMKSPKPEKPEKKRDFETKRGRRPC